MSSSLNKVVIKQKNNIQTTIVNVNIPHSDKRQSTFIIKHLDKVQQQQQQKKQNFPPPSPRKASASAPNTPQQTRRTVLPVKARRVERRKEIVSMTEAIISCSLSVESDDSLSYENSNLTKKKHHNKHYRKNLSTTSVSATTTTTTKPVVLLPPSKKSRSTSSAIIMNNVYAGPTFNNAPAPSALPIPAFSPAFSPALASIDLEKQTTLSNHSKDLMNILSRPPNSFDMDLSEIQRGLRSMLKI